MKPLLSLLVLSALISAEEMSPMEHQSLHTGNKGLSLQSSGEKKAHKLHKIDEAEAIAIAEKACKEKNIKLKLMHRNTLLYYSAKGKSCQLYINALDGKLIDPKRINAKPRQ